MDLRTQKIYDSLIDAMKGLLTEKPFETITVGELCERARTRRATFYNHFSDKYEFFAFMLEEMRRELFARAGTELTTDSPLAYCHALIDLGLTFVEENRALLLSIENNATANGLLMTVTDLLNRERVQETAVHVPEAMHDEITAQFVVGALNQCSRWWISRMDTVSKEEMRDRLYAMTDRLFSE